MAKILTISLAALMGLVTLGAVDCLAGADYMPLKDGFKWEYETFMIDEGLKLEMQAEVTALSVKKFDGLDVVPFKTVMKTEVPSVDTMTQYSFLAETEEGIKIVGVQEPEDSQPRKKLDWEYKYPLLVGNSWVVEEEIHGIKDPVTVPVTHTIESLGDTVTVKAGTFDKCLKITGRYSGKVNLGSYGGTPNIVIECERWYAPGIGNVKSRVKQASTDPEMGTVEMYFELRSYKK